jgi:hypothetical protein
VDAHESVAGKEEERESSVNLKASVVLRLVANGAEQHIPPGWRSVYAEFAEEGGEPGEQDKAEENAEEEEPKGGPEGGQEDSAAELPSAAATPAPSEESALTEAENIVFSYEEVRHVDLPVAHRGMVEKRGHGSMVGRAFQGRLFVLARKDDAWYITYYKGEEASEASKKGEISLSMQGTSVSIDEKIGGRPTGGKYFTICTPDKEYSCRVDSVSEAKEWVDKVRRAIDHPEGLRTVVQKQIEIPAEWQVRIANLCERFPAVR